MSDDLVEGAAYMFKKMMPIAEAQLERIERLEHALEKAKAIIRSASTDWPSLIQTIEKIETGSEPVKEEK